MRDQHAIPLGTYLIQWFADRMSAIRIWFTDRLIFQSGEELGPEFLTIHSQRLADMLGWPFLRELACSHTTPMRISGLTLPLLRDPTVLNPPKTRKKVIKRESADNSR